LTETGLIFGRLPRRTAVPVARLLRPLTLTLSPSGLGERGVEKSLSRGDW